MCINCNLVRSVKMNKIKGSGLVDYILPTVIVGLILGLGIYEFTKSNYLKKYLIASGNMKVTKDKKGLIVGLKNLKGGVYGGTPDAPVKKCDFGGTCVIDYGDFVIEGIPENFDNFIEATGTSGGIDKAAALFELIMLDLEKKGDTEGAEEFKNFSELLKFQAAMIKKFEEKAQGCKSATDQEVCYSKSLQEKFNIDIPENLKEFFPDAKMNSMTYEGLINSLRMDSAVRESRDYKDTFVANNTESPANPLAVLFDSILNNPKYSDSIKDITKNLFITSSDASYRVMDVTLVYNHNGNKENNDGIAEGFYSKYNILTRENEYAAITDQNIYHNPDLNNITNPKFNYYSEPITFGVQ